MPARTSPEPAVASHGGALALIAMRPSGAATTLSGPFRISVAPAPRRGGARPLGARMAGEVGEEAGELALVRGQDVGAAAGGDGGEERRGVVLPERQARRRRAPAPAARRGRRRPAPAPPAPVPSAGPIATAATRAARRGPRRAPPGRRSARSITAVRCAALTASASGGLRQGDEPGAGAQRRPGGEPGGAGAGHPPGDDEGVAAAVLVVLGRRRRHRRLPEGGGVLEGAAARSRRARPGRCRCRRPSAARRAPRPG